MSELRLLEGSCGRWQGKNRASGVPTKRVLRFPVNAMALRTEYSIAPSRNERQLTLLLRAADMRNAAWRPPVHKHRMNWKARSALWLIMMLVGGAASLAPRLWS